MLVSWGAGQPFNAQAEAKEKLKHHLQAPFFLVQGVTQDGFCAMRAATIRFRVCGLGCR